MNKTFNIAKIRDLAKKNETNRAFFDRLADRSKNSRITTVDSVGRLTGGTRREIVELFKEMESLGLGAFVLGRKGGQSRFEWNARLTEVGQAAIGEADEIEQVAAAELEEDADPDIDSVKMVSHSYALRPDLTVTLELPSDLTQQEADRLATFTKTLSFLSFSG